jgi:hypothetical protein
VTAHPIFDELEHGILRAADMAGDWFHPSRDTQAPAATPVNVKPTPSPEDHMSLLTEAKTILHDGLAKLETVDEAAAAKLEAIQANPGAMAVVDSLLGVLHLPPELVQTAENVLKYLAVQYPPETVQAPVAAPAQ